MTALKAGLAKSDVTPRVGVELCGFGPYRCRHSRSIRDRLWARSLAVSVGADVAIVIACDLIGVTLAMTERVRQRIEAATGVPGAQVMISCSHTHSGPATGPYIGWGEPDVPYLETLAQRIAQSAIDAVARLTPATIGYAEVPCEGIGINREYEMEGPALAAALSDDWRPQRPELTDTTCHVLTIRDGQKLLGFVSSFGCHPVVCCAQTSAIHGDFCGVATNQVERDVPGSVGLFLQGAQGDVNSCVVHQPEPESMLALDVIAGRFARAVRTGLATAEPIAVEALRTVRRPAVFSRKDWPLSELRQRLAVCEKFLGREDATDEFTADDRRACMETVYAVALRKLIAQAERGESLSPATELYGLRLGPLRFLGSPFETFQAIKRDVHAAAAAPAPLVLGFVNDSCGYAIDHAKAAAGGYATDMVPFICGALPFAAIHDELVRELLALDAELLAGTT